MKALYKWLSDNRVAIALAIVTGGIVAALVGDTWWGIIAGSITMFIVAWLIKAGWVEAIETVPNRVSAWHEAWKLDGQKNVKTRQQSRQINHAIKQARLSDVSANRGFRLLRFLNGGISDWQYVWLITTCCALILFFFIARELDPSAEQPMYLSIFLFVSIFAFFSLRAISRNVIHLNLRAVGPDISLLDGPTGFFQESKLQNKLYLQQVELRDHNPLISDAAIESELKKTAIEYLQEVVSAQIAYKYYSPALQRFCSGEISLLKVNLLGKVYMLVNLLWLCTLYPVLILLWAVFVFANHHTRLVATTAFVAGGAYLVVSHLFLGGIALENGRYIFGLLVASAIGGAVVHRLGKGKENPFVSTFSRPRVFLLHPSEIR